MIHKQIQHLKRVLSLPTDGEPKTGDSMNESPIQYLENPLNI